ncbi:beta-ketoacyl-ACP synthase II [Parafilimonas sp.]|uniref:beta-ketoacyl-ACP synthase II n=1 Tax=Parafilimonas sp. TaxID=1969739 RepID=UPI0039E4161D
MRRVVITGLGAITPLGNSVKELWENIVAGKSSAAPITKFDATKFKTRFACEVKNFHGEKYFEKKDIRKYDLFSQYAIAAAEEAVQSAQIEFSAYSEEEKADIGVIWGSGNGGISTFEEQVGLLYQGDGTKFSPFFVPKKIEDIAAGIISIRYQLYGPNYCPVSACASSNTAIINAFDTIRAGKAFMMIAGGSEAPITASSIGGFNAAQALSKRNDDPASASRPFDKSRDGFVLGEGAGALILEEYEHAIKRNAPIYAELVGTGQAADAFHLTGTPRDGRGAKLSMRKALTEAGVQPEDVDYINAHATSTPVGDASEVVAIQTVFGNNRPYISGTKSMTGHLLGGAGAVEAIICVMALRHGVVPPTINTRELDEAIPANLNIVLGQPVAAGIQYALNNTFGFGGHTATTLFKKFEE